MQGTKSNLSSIESLARTTTHPGLQRLQAQAVVGIQRELLLLRDVCSSTRVRRLGAVCTRQPIDETKSGVPYIHAVSV